MPRQRRLSPEQLKQKLRDWDPTLGDAQLTDGEGREIERMLAMSPIPATTFSARRRWPPFALATGGGLVVVLLLLVAWGWHATQRTPRRDPLSDPVATTTPAAPDRVRADRQPPAPGRSVQVQLIAKGGTRIVWILNPDLPPLPDLEENSHAK